MHSVPFLSAVLLFVIWVGVRGMYDLCLTWFELNLYTECKDRKSPEL